MTNYNLKGTYEPRSLDEVVGEVAESTERILSNISTSVVISHQTNPLSFFVGGSASLVTGSFLGYIGSITSKISNNEFAGLGLGSFALTFPYVLGLFEMKDEDTAIMKKIIAFGYTAGFALIYSITKN